jgi:hypothetical protein
MTGSLEARNGRGHLFTLGTAVLTADRRAVIGGLNVRSPTEYFEELNATIDEINPDGAPQAIEFSVSKTRRPPVIGRECYRQKWTRMENIRVKPRAVRLGKTR